MSKNSIAFVTPSPNNTIFILSAIFSRDSNLTNDFWDVDILKGDMDILSKDVDILNKMWIYY